MVDEGVGEWLMGEGQQGNGGVHAERNHTRLDIDFFVSSRN